MKHKPVKAGEHMEEPSGSKRIAPPRDSRPTKKKKPTVKLRMHTQAALKEKRKKTRRRKGRKTRRRNHQPIQQLTPPMPTTRQTKDRVTSCKNNTETRKTPHGCGIFSLHKVDLALTCYLLFGNLIPTHAPLVVFRLRHSQIDISETSVSGACALAG